MHNLPVIFLAFANDKQTAEGYLRNLTLERNQIREALSKAASGDHPVCEVVVEADASLETIFNIFQHPRYRGRIAIFHYGGHAGDYKLLLESSRGHTVTAHGDGLVPFLATQKGLQLVFLNGCSTQSQADALIDSGAPAVIGTTRSIPDQVAQVLAFRFYQGLGAGLSIQNAWNDAMYFIKSLHDLEVRDILSSHEDEYGNFPWYIRFMLSSTRVREWNLPDAAGDPVFGLPAIDRKYYLHLPPSPYLGLRRFEQEHAGIFFGRSSEIRKLIDKINGLYPVILYYGHSGTGKSSLLEAGLIPRLESNYLVLVVRRSKEIGLSTSLRHGLLSVQGKAGDPISKMDGESITALWQNALDHAGKPIVCILDQVEEVYTKTLGDSDEEWHEFASNIKPLVDTIATDRSGKLILSFRGEYLPQIQHVLSDYRIAKTDLLLTPMSTQGIIEAITGVAQNPITADHYHLTSDCIEEALVRNIVVDLQHDNNSPIAPMLQILLEKLWDHAEKAADGSRRLRATAYQDIRQKGIALLDFVEEQFARIRQLDDDPQSVFFRQGVEASGLVLDLLMQCVTMRGTADTLPVTAIAEKFTHRATIVPALLEHLIDARVMRADKEGQTRRISLAHDTLASVIRERFEISDRPGQRSRRILEGKIHARYMDGILDAADLAMVEAGLEGMRSTTALEKQLLTRSLHAHDAQQRQRRILKILGVVAVVFILGFGIAATLFWFDANHRAFESETNRIASLASSVFENDHTMGVNLALEAVGRQVNRETGYALSSLTGKAGPMYRRVFTGHLQAIYAVAFSPDGQSFLSGSEDKTAKLWTLNDTSVQTFSGHTGAVSAVTFSPDGKYILTASWDKTVKLWTPDGRLIRTFSAHTGAVPSVIFTADGRNIVAGNADKTAKVWTLEGQERFSLAGHKGAVTVVICSPDGKYLFTGSTDHTGKLWTTDGDFIRDFIGHEAAIYTADFSPDSKYIVTGSWDQTARMWSVEGPLIHTYPVGDDGRGVMERGVMSVAFSPDGQYILSGGYDYRVRLWSVDGSLVKTYFGHEKAVIAVDFSPDGEWILTGSEDERIELWRFDDTQMHKKIHMDNAVFATGYSPDGQYLACAGADGTAKMLDRNGAIVRELPGHKDDVRAITFSGDSKYLLTGSGDSTARLWALDGTLVKTFSGHHGGINDVAIGENGSVLTGSDDHTAIHWNPDGSLQQVLKKHTGPVNGVALSPDGKYMLTGSDDHLIILWDINGQPVLTLEMTLQVEDVTFTPDSKYMLASCRDQKARRWTLDGTEVTVYEGHAGPIAAVAIDPEGKYVLTGSDDRMAKLWTIDGITLQTFSGYLSGVTSVAFDPSGKHIITGSHDGSVQQWLRWDQYRSVGVLPPITAGQKNKYRIQ